MSFSSHFFDQAGTGLTPYGSASQGLGASNVFDYQFNDAVASQSPPQQDVFDPSTQIHLSSAGPFKPSMPSGRSLSSASSNMQQMDSEGASVTKPKISKRARSNRSASSSSPAVGSASIGKSPEAGGSNASKQRPDRRAKFLERNRIAASKCRSKKKEWTNNLEAAARQASQQSRELHQIVAKLRDELLVYKTELMQQRQCSCGELDRILAGGAPGASAHMEHIVSQNGEGFYGDHKQQMHMQQMHMHQQEQQQLQHLLDANYNNGFTNYESTYMDGQ